MNSVQFTVVKTAIFFTPHFFYAKFFFGSPWRKKRGQCIVILRLNELLIFWIKIYYNKKLCTKHGQIMADKAASFKNEALNKFEES